MGTVRHALLSCAIGWTAATAFAAEPATPPGEEGYGFSILHAFSRAADGGRSPRWFEGGLLLASDGLFYGNSIEDARKDNGVSGTVFRMTADGTLTVLHHFKGSPDDGLQPSGGLIEASDGHFYGVTQNGGSHGDGTVFRMTRNGKVTVVHSFDTNANQGGIPLGGLIEGSDGCFYGVTFTGPAGSAGTVFRMRPDGETTILHAFAGGALDGAQPWGGLIEARDGYFYGTTRRGGASDLGTVFRMDHDGHVELIHAFAGAPLDGDDPTEAMIQTRDGELFGTTFKGGAQDAGAAFHVHADGQVTLLHSLVSEREGATPQAALLEASDGYLYWPVSGGGHGRRGDGTVLRIDRQGNSHLIHIFDRHVDGAYPQGALIEDASGNFYGIADLSSRALGKNGLFYRLTPPAK